MSIETNEEIATERKAWATPEVRSVIPAQRTAGGVIFGAADQDNAFYATS